MMAQLLWFVIGAAAGSTANAVIDRLPRHESWFRGRSHCDKCGHVLGLLDLIPLLSYLVLGGKCRYCRKKIANRNFGVELLLGLSFMVIGGHLLSLIVWVTVVIAVMDWETRLVSEFLVLVWGILVIADKFLISNYLVDLNSLLGLAVGVGVIGGLWALSRGRAMGFGDVEIAAVMGWWLGWPKIGVDLWAAFVAGAIMGVIKLIKRLSRLKSEIAFGPFLILGTWAAYLWGSMIWKWVFRF